MSTLVDMAAMTCFTLATACGARSELGVPETGDATATSNAAHDAGLDAASDAERDAAQDVVASPLCVSVDSGFPQSVASRGVHVGHITLSMASCFVDTVIHEGNAGDIDYAFNGDPSTWAIADFATDAGVWPGAEFRGSIHGNVIDVCTGTTFPWSDGCTWATAQRITGDVTSTALTFTYEEQPIVGTGCEPPCSATGPIYMP